MKTSLCRITLCTAALAGAFAGGLPAAVAAPIAVLPTPNCGTGAANNCLQFGDFSVYSLALLNFAATGTVANPTFGDPYYVKSAPGELAFEPSVPGEPGYIVYGTGTSNQKVVTNVAGMDNAFATPSGGIASFDTVTASEPDPDFTGAGDQNGTWDAQTAAIRGVLGSGQFAVFFNLNDTGGDNLSGGDLLAWAQVTISGTNVANKTYYLAGSVPGDPTGKNLSSNNGAPDEQASPPAAMIAAGTADPNVGDPTDPRWTYVHNTICARQAAPGVPQFLHFGPCGAGDPADAKNLDQSLGQNAAAFGIYNQELSSLVMDPNSGYEVIHIRYILGQENNGYEQLFSGQTIVVPEPGTLGLLGLSLFAIPFARRRRG